MAGSNQSGSLPLACFTDNHTIDDADLLPHLVKTDASRADALTDPDERRHFVLRRSFQGLFVKSVLRWPGPFSELELRHKTDHPPHCLRAPGLCLSFSSSGPTAIACAAQGGAIGIDIERFRTVEAAAALATRFFTAEEAAAIAGLPLQEQDIAFLKFWSVKEAGLKATGNGIVSGLNKFELFLAHGAKHPALAPRQNDGNDWQLHFVDCVPNHVVAVVHSAVAIPHMA